MSRQSRRRRGQDRERKLRAVLGRKQPPKRRTVTHGVPRGDTPYSGPVVELVDGDTIETYDPSQFVSLRSVSYPNEDGTITQVFGAISARFWLGTPGRSAFYAQTRAMKAPITLEEQDGVLERSRQSLSYTLAHQVASDTSLEMLATVQERLQLLVIWVAEDNLFDRLGAFEDGWETAHNPGKRRIRMVKGGGIRDIVAQLAVRQAASAMPSGTEARAQYERAHRESNA